MRALPKISGSPESWQRRAEQKERAKESASFERRNHVIAVARQIRIELKQEKKEERV